MDRKLPPTVDTTPASNQKRAKLSTSIDEQAPSEEETMSDAPGDDSTPFFAPGATLGGYLSDDDIVSDLPGKQREELTRTPLHMLTGTLTSTVLIPAIQEKVTFNLDHFLKSGEKEPQIAVEFEGLRLAVQDFGFTVPLTHNLDVVAFKKRLYEVRKWHNESEKRNRFLAPLLPVVQSSGTGKSRLLFELRKVLLSENEACRSILLTDEDLEAAEIVQMKKRKHYDKIYYVNGEESEDDGKQRLRNCMLEQCQLACNETNGQEGTPIHVFLFFDEAQHLAGNHGFLLRVLRWIVRERGLEYQITAVLAGTNSSLANFFPEKAIESRNSRCLKDIDDAYFVEGTEPYSPFFMLRTQGCLSKRSVPTTMNNNDPSEYEKMIRFSRPLFKVLYEDGKLGKNAEYDIAKKIVLGKTRSWATDEKSCLSVLATRVQMGATSTSVASELVSKGYAHLTSFRNKNSDQMEIPSLASFAFLPDPVCARMAMCLMDDEFNRQKKGPSGSPRNEGDIRGAKKQELVSMMGTIFSKGLCFPAKGDLGEIAVALYLLFCGDILRKEKNNEFDNYRWYHDLSVDFSSWMQLVWNKDSGAASGAASCDNDGKLMVNCIQFFRFSLRSPLTELGDNAFLESLYQKASAIYCSTNTEAIDAVIPCYDSSTYIHLPVFLSIKNYAALYPAEATKFLRTSYEALRREGISKGILLLVIAGQDRKVDVSHYENEWTAKCPEEELLISSTGSPQPQFRNCLRVGFVCVHDDVFGIDKMLQDSSFTKDQQTAEIYSMHSELIHRNKSPDDGNLKLPARYRRDVRDFFEETCGMLCSPGSGESSVE